MSLRNRLFLVFGLLVLASLFANAQAATAQSKDTKKSTATAKQAASASKTNEAGPIVINDSRVSSQSCGEASTKLTAASDNGYPCCTDCHDCHLDCVGTDSNGNCNHWKYNCTCDRHCPCK